MSDSLSTVFGAVFLFLLVLIASLAWHFGAWIVKRFDAPNPPPAARD